MEHLQYLDVEALLADYPEGLEGSQFRDAYVEKYDYEFKLPEKYSKLFSFLRSIPHVARVKTGEGYNTVFPATNDASPADQMRRYLRLFKWFKSRLSKGIDGALANVYKTLLSYVEERRDAQVQARFQNMSELQALQEVCFNLVQEKPTSITKCKRLLARIFINIYDYVAERYDMVYNNRWELRRRCAKIGFYPLDEAKSSVALKSLLKTLS